MKKFFDAVSKVFKTDPNKVGDDGLTRLQRAIIADDEDKVRKLINEGADVNECGMLNYQPLHLSLTRDRSQIALLLMDASADINAKDKMGRTPLHIAVSQGHEFIALRLLKLGADPNQKNAKGQTALHLVSASKPDIIAYLSHYKADLNAVESNGFTALHLFLKNKHMQLAEQVLKRKANPNIINRNGESAFTMVLNDDGLVRDEALVTYMLLCGANIEARNNDGESLIFCLLRNAKKDLFDKILPFVDLSATTKSGSNLLHSILLNGMHAFLPAVVAAAPELMQQKNNEDMTPLAAYLSRVYFHSSDKFDVAARLLITAGDNINTQDNKGRTLVHYACRNNRIELLEFLINNGADLDLKAEGSQPPISALIDARNMVMLDMVLDAGADPDQPDARGWTILDRLAERNDRDSSVVQRLIVAGGQYNKQLPLRPDLMRTKKPEAPAQNDNALTPLIKRLPKPSEQKPEDTIQPGRKLPKGKGPKFG